MVFFTSTMDELPENSNFPEHILGNRFLHGDVFIVKLQPHEYGVNGWAEYDDVPAEFLNLPSMRGRRTAYYYP